MLMINFTYFGIICKWYGLNGRQAYIIWTIYDGCSKKAAILYTGQSRDSPVHNQYGTHKWSSLYVVFKYTWSSQMVRKEKTILLKSGVVLKPADSWEWVSKAYMMRYVLFKSIYECHFSHVVYKINFRSKTMKDAPSSVRLRSAVSY